MNADEQRWREWKERTFGSEYMIWHDGLWTGDIISLTGERREEALTMLRLGVSLGDAHAAEALAAMGDVQTIENMRLELGKAQGSERVRLALAIHTLRAEPELAKHLIDVLKSTLFWSHRIDAAMGLRHFAGEEDERALLESVEADPEYLVRYHAASSLLVRWKITPSEITSHPEIFERITGPRDEQPNTEADFKRFREARDLLERMRR